MRRDARMDFRTSPCWRGSRRVRPLLRAISDYRTLDRYGSFRRVALEQESGAVLACPSASIAAGFLPVQYGSGVVCL